MKTRYIILSLAAALTATVACQKESDHYLDALTVSSSYVTIPSAGGSKTITVEASEGWSFDIDIAKDTSYTDAKKGTVKETIQVNQLKEYDWVTISPASGSAGKTTVTFTAPATENAKTATFKIQVGEKTQNIIVVVGENEVEEVSAKDVIDGPDGKTYRVTGTCTKITSTSYGNWYLTDSKGDQIYIYGTVDASGSYNWSGIGIELGDVVTVQGPKTTYGTTVELVDASVIEIQKALLASDDIDKVIPMGDDTFTVTLEQKGEGISFESKADWLTIAGNGYTVASDGKYVFTIKPEANATGARRTGTLVFKSTKYNSKKKVTEETELPVTVTQLAETTLGTLGDIAATILPGTSKAPINFDYTIGKATVTYVNGSNIFLEDATSALLIYSSEVKLSVGQTVTGRVFGRGYAYNNLPEATEFNTALATVGAAPKLSADLPKPTEVTLADLIANWDSYFCKLITIKGLSVTDGVEATYEVVGEDGKKSTGDRSGTVSDGTNSLPVYVQVKKYILMEEGKTYDLTCIPTVNKTTRQLGIWDASHVVEVK